MKGIKKAISLLLTFALVLGIMPIGGFSAQAAEMEVVTYNFYPDGHSDLTTTGKTVILEDGSGNKYFQDYGTDRDWAYLGTNATGEVTDNAIIDLFNGYQRTIQQAQNTWVEYKIRVPKKATYTVSGTAFCASSSTNRMDIYIAPLTGDIATTFADTLTYGTVSDGTRAEATDFKGLGIAVATAALALNNGTETDEWIKWIMAYDDPDTGIDPKLRGEHEGGNVEWQLINEVDRDGHGNEAAPGYNEIWVRELVEVAGLLSTYKPGDPDFDLYANPKFVKCSLRRLR